ncbi:formate dehydrogenase accessory sulfurtransferase FdhD [Pseudanabaena yagii]|uniref:Sulfur carrier protein FdhD n=1 Tax=Pseudanabaena yagii GIHE-NHR1 TaxID=2722753 RepID=A0ABX1LTL2_9CYAN|nr:formate dehydrogenase accessory sulfurtransferase FdhD [Pseudanabaena yagii]NMF58380.1 formate dehydrogenase accessory sulfurtransferase FdhD [Pseudanabaena yagii GIHE-NHR1]
MVNLLPSSNKANPKEQLKEGLKAKDSANNTAKINTKIWAVQNHQVQMRWDDVATEEPLEIRLMNSHQAISVTMRTPIDDFDLVAGFLYSEGLIGDRRDIQRMNYCVNPEIDGKQRLNIINVELREELVLNLSNLERHFFTNSACGVCGKNSIEALKSRGCQPIVSNPQDRPISAEIIYSLAEKLRLQQKVFAATGGLHAAALFNFGGELLNLREDVGRHNALDKLIGSALLADEIPLSDRIVMMSGRTSFELVQKSILAQIPIVCAVSPPSSLAIALAQEFGITLVGFLRENRFNVYAGWERIILD